MTKYQKLSTLYKVNSTPYSMYRLTLLVAVCFFSTLAANAQSDPTYKNYLRKHSPTIQREASDKMYHFSFLKKQLKGHRIVAIGEFNHGSSEIFKLKNKLIQYLHQELDYDVVLFESGIGEMLLPNYSRDTLSARRMIYSLVGPWRTRSHVPLMDLVRNSPKLAIGGFDVQKSGGAFSRVVRPIAKQIENGTGIDLMALEERNDKLRKLLNGRELTDEISSSRKNVLKDYKQVLSFLTTSPIQGSGEIPLKLITQTIRNRTAYIDYRYDFLKDKDWNKRWLKRDSLMAENVRFFTEEIYPDKKVVILAHNFHIAKHNPKEEVMGEYLQTMLKEDIYTIGLYAANGSYANNSRQERMLSASEGPGDIKHYINLQPDEVQFLNIPDSKKKGIEWIFENIIINDTFNDLSSSKTVDLAKWFDGLIFLKTVSPAIYKF